MKEQYCELFFIRIHTLVVSLKN